jgi:N,N-dimethylformamidase
MARSAVTGRLLAYVSDERYVAVSGAVLEFDDGTATTILTSAPSGAVYGDLPAGHYRVTLARDGYGAKRCTADLAPGQIHQFRMLSEGLTGYVWPKWVRSGDSGSVRVHSPEPYRLSLARLGADAEPPAVIGWFDEHGPRATVQVTPDGDYSQAGLDWVEHAKVTAPDRSGLYCFHIESESGAHFSIPWVVAPREPASGVAVLASTNTWNAYNNFGGRSNYINAAALPPAPIVFARTDLARYADGLVSEHSAPDGQYAPLSFRRPEPLNQIGLHERPADPIRGRQPCHLAAAEWRLLSFLEREGYAPELYAEAQLHDGTLELDRYRVLILSTHPEYWSRQMYDAVRSWVFERGGKLMYLGGNGLDCEVEFVESGALVFRTEDPPADGPFENRMHRTHAATSGLLGVVYTESGAMTAAPYAVVAPDHWAFTGTGLAAGDLFGTQSLHERIPGGASGHETDKRTPRTPAGTTLLAKGRNVDDGGAEMIHFGTPSGGEVFSAGSITWSAAVQVDHGVAAVTRNVLERFLKP